MILWGVVGLLSLLLVRHAWFVLTWSSSRPPLVAGLPLIGCALQFRGDPVEFLTRMGRKYDGVFTVNMAGCLITIVSDPVALRKYLTSRESVLSARDAIATFGFVDTLGYPSVYTGADLHRKLVQSRVSRSSVLPRHISRMLESIPVYMRTLLPPSPGAPPATALVFDSMRRLSLRVSVAYLLGEELLNEVRDFENRFMVFQDDLEDVTAKVVALPKILAARPLRKVEQLRELLRRDIAAVVETKHKGGAVSADAGDNATYLEMLLEEELGKPEDEYGLTIYERVAEYIIGMLFAAHKNVGICSANVILFLLEHESLLQRVQDGVRGTQDKLTPDVLREAVPLLDQIVQETLRLTSHTMGSMRKVKLDDGFRLPTSTGKSYVLPKDSFVAGSHISRGMDARVFPDPERFDPARFEDDVVRARNAEHQFNHVPFSGGVHACPGKRLAEYQVKAMVWYWLDLLTVAPAEDVPELNFERATLAQREHDVRVQYDWRG